MKVLNKHRHGVPAGAVYIGRGSKWGNPFRIGPDGDRATVIAKYERWLARQYHLLAAADALRGHDLVCFCAPLPCHGDVLLRFANMKLVDRLNWVLAMQIEAASLAQIKAGDYGRADRSDDDVEDKP